MPAMRAQASAIYIGIITIVASAGPVIVSYVLYVHTYMHIIIHEGSWKKKWYSYTVHRGVCTVNLSALRG